ncbi:MULTISPECIES: hypothetical protein [Methylobacterium]|uniref:Hypervirulence associated protein TUDOR domain-containing protein n=2 Tax=Pseudomonadota TaxID=1224 RepID=A0ABQ4T3B6_9HYPH|nr:MULTISPECIES: hypothetical protein [Methylobacterium]PIU07190.1 MAG: hypothetical protein COT56_05980 [Methylobacterium sp. CG09_land_8_20_14_0_10_71_15]PIU14063.1 MAG: hypothetical protein COT28_08905 [Methylobacterium sp. CG08_land_8_20_14_0_20_71_15]GBU19587.1 hypothetical protein AwMethylo_38020 [Methylobacterium sp.]GJE08514.1 hypothetical protein AOPFMNJM_3853 [Methylobacterium jeotgali]
MSHKFKLGQRVRYAHTVHSDGASSRGDVCEVVRLMPEDQTGEPSYRIRSSTGERAVREGEIILAMR